VVSRIFYFHLYLGRRSNLTSIFFRWVETTNMKINRLATGFVRFDFLEAVVASSDKIIEVHKYMLEAG